MKALFVALVAGLGLVGQGNTPAATEPTTVVSVLDREVVAADASTPASGWYMKSDSKALGGPF